MSGNRLVKAYQFELRGSSATITYHDGPRQLHYVGPSKPPLDDVFEITETVSPLDTPIGRLLTATLAGRRGHVVSAVSVLLPQVNLEVDQAGMGEGPVASPAELETVAVWTDILSAEGGPDLVPGAVDRYVSAEMEGDRRRAPRVHRHPDGTPTRAETPGRRGRVHVDVVGIRDEPRSLPRSRRVGGQHGDHAGPGAFTTRSSSRSSATVPAVR